MSDQHPSEKLRSGIKGIGEYSFAEAQAAATAAEYWLDVGEPDKAANALMRFVERPKGSRS